MTKSLHERLIGACVRHFSKPTIFRTGQRQRLASQPSILLVPPKGLSPFTSEQKCFPNRVKFERSHCIRTSYLGPSNMSCIYVWPYESYGQRHFYTFITDLASINYGRMTCSLYGLEQKAMLLETGGKFY